MFKMDILTALKFKSFRKCLSFVRYSRIGDRIYCIFPQRLKNTINRKWYLGLLPINTKQLEVEFVDRQCPLAVDCNVGPFLELPKFDNITVSIIIYAHNQFKLNVECIESIAKNTNDISYEVILVDDVSNDETSNIENYIGNLAVIRNTKNKGRLLNCNNAAKQVKSEYIFILNNNTQVQKGWLKESLELIQHDETIGLVGVKLLYPDGTLQQAGGILWQDGSSWSYGRGDDPNKPEYSYMRETDYISGAAMLVRKSVWDAIGGFDIRYEPVYCEDSDFAFEVRKRGYKVMYQPESMVVHFERQSTWTSLEKGVRCFQNVTSEKFLEKWKDILEKEHYPNGQNVFCARGRGRDKKTILVIDHSVPEFDKEAGSRTTYMYLKLFLQQGFNLVFMGENFYQSEPYTSILQRLGVEVLYGHWYRKNYQKWMLDNKKNIDFVYLNRPHISEQYIDFIKNELDAKIIFYGHDLHYMREHFEHELTGDKIRLASSKNWKKREYDLMKKCDVVYYPSILEEKEIKKTDDSINVKTIIPYVYDEYSKIAFLAAIRKDLLFVGGFTHRPNVDAMVWFVNNIFTHIINWDATIKLYIVGSNPTDEILSFKSENVVVTGFISEEELQKYYKKCRVVIVPLRYGGGVKGKVVEALYYQMPIVTTDIGIEGIEGIDDVVLVANNEDSFVNSIQEVYSEEQRLEELSYKAWEYVRNSFSLEKAWSKIKHDFN